MDPNATTDTTTVADTTTTETTTVVETTTETTTEAPTTTDATTVLTQASATAIDVGEPANSQTLNDVAQTQDERFAQARLDGLTNHAADHDDGVGEESQTEEVVS